MRHIQTPIGELIITGVYVEYDGPRVFACQSASGQLYFGIWVEEQPPADRWLFVPTSRLRLGAVKTGTVSLRDAVTVAEDGWAWLVSVDHDTGVWSAERKAVTEIDHRYLPAHDARLTLGDNR